MENVILNLNETHFLKDEFYVSKSEYNFCKSSFLSNNLAYDKNEIHFSNMEMY